MIIYYLNYQDYEIKEKLNITGVDVFEGIPSYMSLE